MDDWFTHELPVRAPAGGVVDPLDNKFYRGGELLPFYVPRPVMPQVDEVDYGHLLSYLRGEGVEVGEETVDPRTLRAHQRVDHARVRAMTPGQLRKPILVSLDSFILDGNHRWFGHIHPHLQPISCERVGLPFLEAIAALFSFPGTYTLAHHAQTN